MAAWVTLTDDSVLSAYLAASQVSAIRNSQQVPGQPDPFLEIMPSICARIRTAIARNGKKVSATPGAIPLECKDYAVLLILDRMSVRIPTLQLTADQRGAAKEAREYIDKMGGAMFAVSMPDDPVDPDVQIGGGVRTSFPRRPTATPSGMDGLLAGGGDHHRDGGRDVYTGGYGEC